MGYDVDPLDVIARGTRYKHAVQSGATLRLVSSAPLRRCLRPLAHIWLHFVRAHPRATIARTRHLK